MSAMAEWTDVKLTVMASRISLLISRPTFAFTCLHDLSRRQAETGWACRYHLGASSLIIVLLRRQRREAMD